MNKNINDRINAAMESIEGIEQAEPKPFLLTRINAAMQESSAGSTWAQVASFLKRPAVAIFSGAVILLLNIYAFNSNGLFSSAKDMAKSTKAAKYDFTTINVYTEIQEP